MSKTRTIPAPLHGIGPLLAKIALGRLRWVIGAPLLVLACGMLALWWSFLQQSRAVDQLTARSTASAQARLVDRYFLLQPADHIDDPSSPGCNSLCRTRFDSVAVLEFDTADGRTQRVQFAHRNAHDWRHPTTFEYGIPLAAPVFRISPSFRATLQNDRVQNQAYGPALWDELWSRIDDPTHWLMRQHSETSNWRMPLRYDPAHPEVAVLDSAVFAQERTDVARYLRESAIGALVFGGLAVVMVLLPAVRLLLYGVAAIWQWAVIAVICVGVPWWMPHAQSIAPYLSTQSAQLAQALQREFGHTIDLGFAAVPVTDTATLDKQEWTLAGSQRAAFFASVALTPLHGDPLDHAAAYDALQAQIDAQWQALNDEDLIAAIKTLSHYDAASVWELFVPALMRIANDQQRAAAVRSEATTVLGYCADSIALPDVDGFLYRHRLDNFARLIQLPDAAAAATARRRLTEAETLLARQLETL